MRMSFGVVSGVGRGMGVLDGMEIVEEEGQFCGKYGRASHCNQWDSLREGRRRGSSRIILGFFVIIISASLAL